MTRSDVLPGPRAAPVRALLGEERCDRCCAPAAVRILLPSGLELSFCCHHARRYEAALLRSGGSVRVDWRSADLYW